MHFPIGLLSPDSGWGGVSASFALPLTVKRFHGSLLCMILIQCNGVDLHFLTGSWFFWTSWSFIYINGLVSGAYFLFVHLVQAMLKIRNDKP